MGGVVGRDADLHAIPYHNFNPVFLHPSGEHTSYGDIVIAFYFHGAAA